MVANCIKFREEVYKPDNGSPVPMLCLYVDVPGMSDIVKVQIAQKRVEGQPKVGECYIDCAPRFSNGGRINWKPCLVRFN